MSVGFLPLAPRGITVLISIQSLATHPSRYCLLRCGNFSLSLRTASASFNRWRACFAIATITVHACTSSHHVSYHIKCDPSSILGFRLKFSNLGQMEFPSFSAVVSIRLITEVALSWTLFATSRTLLLKECLRHLWHVIGKDFFLFTVDISDL